MGTNYFKIYLKFINLTYFILYFSDSLQLSEEIKQLKRLSKYIHQAIQDTP